MPQFKIFSGFNEDELTTRVNTFVNDNKLLWKNVEQEFSMTATNYDDGVQIKIIYKYAILLRYESSETFQGE